MINLHESIGPGEDRPRDHLICSQTRASVGRHATDCAALIRIGIMVITMRLQIWYMKYLMMNLMRNNKVCVENSLNLE